LKKTRQLLADFPMLKKRFKKNIFLQIGNKKVKKKDKNFLFFFEKKFVNIQKRYIFATS